MESAKSCALIIATSSAGGATISQPCSRNATAPNAIEGNTLSLYETKMVIEEGVTSSGQPLRYYIEARNHAEALDQVCALAEQQAPITTATVLLLHRLMIDDVLPDAGQWRAGYVHIRGAAHIPPHPREVPQLIAGWIAWLDDEGLVYSPILRAALAHVVFEAIHPFSDGNGRAVIIEPHADVRGLSAGALAAGVAHWIHVQLAPGADEW
jgi:Fic family protein